ncbi:anti-sigma-E factor RseA [Xenorhabdus nematophila]|uniref:Anti-sigma-E factor RseA n=1 Tax=Xenorhabdus nematophila (strain ATCC 19061 / DSM 3370 / CCUG 14189 / LMG 1036 / NCIMB 9965 / AN6) TaxID=406817 RepID=D3VLJ4_XENNA|nr:anti-sigma-E factor RseA [Xenorhabdus nematophila]CEE91158.1 anti sigma E (sigma 24) factor, negative regulator [Xenorhabdus nematophila str. Anatoliense]CEF32805.1 anti sigma E (sigma 24) factor, negative regulator [Xenorhabdus nematophila str. Websteri]AYA39435.1 anti-sigma-E factor RseA [Xenorhabdus nematophila]KHD28424.1 anti-RNA polymerase sigma factor SigE [Xenorhabdus nematophila]MBA0018001.1 anti-sigma-E factor RseA [Xenorhabdus nematophila]
MQREKLSALMDGEALDSEVVHLVSEDTIMQKQWERYHLVRDVLRGDIGEVLHLDIANQVAQAIEKEPVHIKPEVVLESQPKPETWSNMPFWEKIRPWASQITQVGMAACVSLAVIIGVQQYNGSDSVDADTQSDVPAFNTLPVMGSASPVGLAPPVDDEAFGGDLSMQVRESNKRIDAMLQQYELDRRLHTEKNQKNTQVSQPLGVQAQQQ